MPCWTDIKRKGLEILRRHGFSALARAEIHERWQRGGEEYGFLAFMRGAADHDCWSCGNSLDPVNKLQAHYCPWCGKAIGEYGHRPRMREELLDAACYVMMGVLNGETTDGDPDTVADLYDLVRLLDRDEAAQGEGVTIMLRPPPPVLVAAAAEDMPEPE